MLRPAAAGLRGEQDRHPQHAAGLAAVVAETAAEIVAVNLVVGPGDERLARGREAAARARHDAGRTRGATV